MAIIKTENQQEELGNDEPIKRACMDLGVPFGCENGVCGTCMIDIIEGAENLNELNEKETDMDRDKFHRLACQARIKKGTVKIKY